MIFGLIAGLLAVRWDVTRRGLRNWSVQIVGWVDTDTGLEALTLVGGRGQSLRAARVRALAAWRAQRIRSNHIGVSCLPAPTTPTVSAHTRTPARSYVAHPTPAVVQVRTSTPPRSAAPRFTDSRIKR